LQAAGSVAIAHGQLEHILCMTVKSLSGVSVQEALDATSNMKAWELRATIKKLFNQKTRDEAVRIKMKSLLAKAERLSNRRNELIHRPWGVDEIGKVVVKDSDHEWGDPPTPLELNVLSQKIRETALELNTARLDGFIKDVVDNAE